jgi:uncharacterized alkaline shock family protein YloU
VNATPTMAPDPAATPPRARTAELVTHRGETTIAPSVVARIARRAATEVDGVDVVSGGGLRGLLEALRPDRPTGARADMASRQTAVELTLAVCWPRGVRAVTNEVRRRVKARVQELTGYVVTDVDIVVDALPSPSPSRRAQ